MSKTLIRLSAVFLFTLSTQSYSKEGLKLSGFGSIGVLSTNSEQAGFRRDNADSNITLSGDVNVRSLSSLGVQANYSVNDKLELVAQAYLHDHPKQNSDNILRIASINYEPIPNWQLRMGRFSPRAYLLSDSRPIGYAYLWTMPVQEFYSLLTYNFVDGIDTTYTLALGDGYLRLGLSYGYSSIYIYEPNVGTSQFDLNMVSDLNFEYEIQNWLFRVAWSKGRTTKNAKSLENLRGQLSNVAQQLMWQEGLEFSEQLLPEKQDLDFISSAITYNDGDINFKAEYSQFQTNGLHLPAVRSAYLSLGKAIGSYTPYLILGKIDTEIGTAPELTPPVQSPELLQLLNASYELIETGIDQQSVGVGLRYEINSSASIKLQWSHKWVEENGYDFWARDRNFQLPDGDGSFDVLSARFDFIFK